MCDESHIANDVIPSFQSASTFKLHRLTREILFRLHARVYIGNLAHRFHFRALAMPNEGGSRDHLESLGKNDEDCVLVTDSHTACI